MTDEATGGKLPASPYGVPIYRMVWSANLVSNFGTVLQAVGASWLMVSLSGSATLVALVQASTTLPIMLLSLVTGAVADNFDRRRIMLGAQTLMFGAASLLTLCALLDLLTPWMLLGFTFLIGCGTALNAPAWQASVGEMVPKPLLSSAIAYNSMSFNIARSVGPAIGGAIVAAAGASAAFCVNAVSYLGLITVLLRWKRDVPERRLPRERLGSAIGAGVRYVLMSPSLKVILTRSATFGLFSSSISALMPLVARDLIRGGPLTYGLLLGAFGLGAVAAALTIRTVRARFSTETIVRGASIAFMIGAIGTGLSRSMVFTMPVLALAGAGWVMALSTFNASIQLGSPRWVVARAVSLYQMVTFGGMAAGSWVFGALADMRGVNIALITAGCAQAIVLAIGLVRRLPDMGGENLDLLDRWQEPATMVPVEPRSGPVVVTIDYRIDPENWQAFMDIMAERRRIRIRDGARRWRLLQDLNDETLWIERYQAPTWLDYVRHNQRRTHADMANLEALRTLYADGEPPRVRQKIERHAGGAYPGRIEPMDEVTPSLTDPARYS
ncbi:MFS transporter [Stakelama sp. CBK3Z-3]|uniref:MFS transporter n=1 Tax=Stakelama flava TaxID=2860338 RepID=A0ABS6XJ26_9SPHN|nr:MFS transporter [Stakelama flava]MBW4329460.1 MFS transporter [Stakelama flava]